MRSSLGSSCYRTSSASSWCIIAMLKRHRDYRPQTTCSGKDFSCAAAGRIRSFTQKNAQDKPDYWTNDGTVEGVWIFSRHGDRTPGRPLAPEHRRDEEAAYWMTKLPVPDTATVYERFSYYFPVQPTADNGAHENFIDAPRNPFGFLTNKGLLQLAENGKRFFNRYNRRAHHFPECTNWQTAHDFLSVWDVTVFSTNYLRTILSVQSFLDGLLGTGCYEPPKHDRLHDPSIIKEARIPPRIIDRQTDQLPTVNIQVRDLRSDPLNAFDRNPDLIAELVSEVMLSDDFLHRDGNAAPLAARLANILPGLVKRKGTSDFSKRSPSGINWVEAADHFVCRAAHDVAFAQFTDFENDDRVTSTLHAMSHPTLAHLSWRFRKWYQHERLLAVIAAPPLREIADQILKTPELSSHERRPFVVYSCHDITILGLLYGIGADFLAVDETYRNDVGSWRWWPPYASNLVFELVRVHDGTPGPHSHVIRILLNGMPVRSIAVDSTVPAAEGGPEGMLFVGDFERLVGDLETAGGYDYSKMLGRHLDKI